MKVERHSARAIAVAAGVVVLLAAGVGFAQEEDHLLGYRVKDVEKIKLDTSHTVANQFVVGESCEVKGKAKFLLAQSSKDGGDDPRGGPAGHFVCYKTKCSSGTVPAPTTGDNQVTQQTLEFKKAQLLCMPFDKFLCGDGDVDPGEECDGNDDALCPGFCLPSCVCIRSCPADGSPDGCVAYRDDPTCTAACDLDEPCNILCTDAVNAGCSHAGLNATCDGELPTNECCPPAQ